MIPLVWEDARGRRLRGASISCLLGIVTAKFGRVINVTGVMPIKAQLQACHRPGRQFSATPGEGRSEPDPPFPGPFPVGSHEPLLSHVARSVAALNRGRRTASLSP